jgi:antitoxin ParD1/3/4
MTFEVFLPESMADWLRAKIAAGMFNSPGEAAFVAFQDLQELDRHPAARQALLTAMIEASVNDPRPGIPIEEVRAQFLAQMREDAKTRIPSPRSPPAVVVAIRRGAISKSTSKPHHRSSSGCIK